MGRSQKTLNNSVLLSLSFAPNIKGVIQLPSANNDEPNIIIVSQEDYFALDYTLQQILAYPDKISNDPAEAVKIKELLQAAFGSNDGKKPRVLTVDLTSKENWNDFSGGEKKDWQ